VHQLASKVVRRPCTAGRRAHLLWGCQTLDPDPVASAPTLDPGEHPPLELLGRGDCSRGQGGGDIGGSQVCGRGRVCCAGAARVGVLTLRQDVQRRALVDGVVAAGVAALLEAEQVASARTQTRVWEGRAGRGTDVQGASLARCVEGRGAR